MDVAQKKFHHQITEIQSIRIAAIGLALALLAGIPFIPILVSPGYPITHEWLRYAHLLGQVMEAQDYGVYFPRWLPHLAGGFGMPTFVFYQYLFFFAASIIAKILPFSLAHSVWITAYGFSLLGAVGTYLCARQYIRQIPAFAVTALFMFTPYAFVNLHVRGALSEFAATQLIPWVVYFALLLSRAKPNSRFMALGTLGLVVSLWAILMMHPLVAMPVWVLAGLILVTGFLQAPKAPRKTKILFSGAAFLVAFLAGSIYWYPATILSGWVNLDNAFSDHFQAYLNLVDFQTFFQRDFSTYVPDLNPNLNATKDGTTYQLGLLHFLVATIGAWQGRKHLLFPVSYAIYLVLIFLMSPLAIGFWKYFELVRVYQFPWRLLGITSFVQVICALGLFWKLPHLRFLNYWIVAALAICAFLIWHVNMLFNPGYMKIPYSDVSSYVEQFSSLTRSGWMTFSSRDEFLPITANPELINHKDELIKKPRGLRDLVEIENGTVTELEKSNPYRIAYLIDSEDSTEVTINQHYFPGWRVLINDTRVSDEHLRDWQTEQGLMRIKLGSAGPHELKAEYAGPSGLSVLYGSSLIAFSALAAGLFFTCRTTNGMNVPTCE